MIDIYGDSATGSDRLRVALDSSDETSHSLADMSAPLAFSAKTHSGLGLALELPADFGAVGSEQLGNRVTNAAITTGDERGASNKGKGSIE